MAWSDFTQATIIPQAGDQGASASPTGAATADLVSAGTNTNGIVITSATAAIFVRGASTDGSPYLRLLANSVIQLEAILRKVGSAEVAASVSLGNAIEVPAGQAVSYTANLGGTSGSYFGFVRIAWRHKA